MSSLQLQWTSFIKEEHSSSKDDLCTKVKTFSKKIKMRNKKRMISPERMYKPRQDDGYLGAEGMVDTTKDTTNGWMPQISEAERRTNPDDVVKPFPKSPLSGLESDWKTDRQSVKSVLPAVGTKCSEKNVNENVGKSSKTRKKGQKEEKEEEKRKLTRDVIFEAEQLVIKSEIDNIGAKTPPLKHCTSPANKITREPLWEQLKETKFERSVSSSTPSLASAVEESSCSKEPNIAVDREASESKNQKGNSKKSSINNAARRIRSRSTSRPLNLFTSTKHEKDIPIEVKKQHVQSEEGVTALLRAARNDSIFQVQSLISHGISTEILDQRGWTPLFIALENENNECAEVLAQLNANVNFVHANGMTILHQITSTGMYKGVKFLLRHGASVNIEDSQGWPAVHHAIKRNHLKCAALLLAAGCDSKVYTEKRVQEYDEVVKLATVGKWKYHWQRKLDIDMDNEIQL